MKNTIILNIPGQSPKTIDADHYQVVFKKEFPGPFYLVVRRCDHGSLIVHSRDAGGDDRFMDASSLSNEAIASAIRHCLPEMTDAAAADIMPRLVEEILAKPLPKKSELPENKRLEVLVNLVNALLGDPANSELTENLCVETPNEQGELEIRMSSRGPVIIAAGDWPVIGEEFFGIKGVACISVRIRQHVQKGSLIIYGENRRFDKPESIYAGELLAGAAAAGAPHPGRAVRLVVGDLMGPSRHNEPMINKLMGKLPSERL